MKDQVCNSSTCAWTDTSSCYSTCTNDAECVDEGDLVCNGNDVMNCTKGTDNCLHATTLVKTCSGSTPVCNEGNCISCPTTCTKGFTRCSGSINQTCVADGACNVWTGSTSCSPSTCDPSSGTCKESCPGLPYFCATPTPLHTILNNTYFCDETTKCYQCSAGYTYNNDDGSCVCTSQDPPHQECQTTGDTRCNVNTVQTCTQNNGCSYWTDTTTCGADQICSNGQCISNECSYPSSRLCFTDATGTYTGTCPGTDCAPKGECEAGTQTCSDQGKWGSCDGQVLPTTETCNSKDDDCDGTVDNLPAGGSLCDDGFTCSGGGCVANCEHPYFCSSSAGLLASLFSQYYCSSGRCYACNDHAHQSTSSDQTVSADQSVSTCVCDSGYSQCESGGTASCVNTKTDPNNCGGCNNVCEDGKACINGNCSTCSNNDDCNDNNVCTADNCVNGACGHDATNDGERCSTSSSKGTCEGGSCVACVDECSATTCEDGKVKNCVQLSGSACYVWSTQLTPCPYGKTCSAGTCVDVVECTSNRACDDGNPCTTDTCNNNACVYADNTAACTTADNKAGTCNDGLCICTSCTPDDACVKGDQVCQDDQSRSCTWNGNSYVWGPWTTCTCKDDTSCVQCSNIYRIACENNDVVNVDTGCGETKVLRQCSDNQVCTITDSKGSCRDLAPCESRPGTTSCDGSCVDLQSSHDNCGACSNQCTSWEQCEQGTCIKTENCTVVCDKDGDCKEDEFCVNPGDCQLSRCQPEQIIEQNSTVATTVEDLLFRNGQVFITTALNDSRIIFSVTNLGADTLTDVRFTVQIPPVMSANPEAMTVTGAEHEPIPHGLRFTLPKLVASEEVVADAGHPLDPTYFSYIIVGNITYTSETNTSLVTAWEKTKDALTIGIKTEKTANETSFDLALLPSKTLGGVRVPVQIPKCMAQHVAELGLSGEYDIVQDDPLIVWNFDELDKQGAIRFTVPKNISDDCAAQLQALAYAQTVGKPLNPWLAFLLIPVIGFVFIFFQRFGPKAAQKHLGRNEFYAIARQNGTADEEIEREWRDYRRRF